jgi:hypothetical protein
MASISETQTEIQNSIEIIRNMTLSGSLDLGSQIVKKKHIATWGRNPFTKGRIYAKTFGRFKDSV